MAAEDREAEGAEEAAFSITRFSRMLVLEVIDFTSELSAVLLFG